MQAEVTHVKGTQSLEKLRFEVKRYLNCKIYYHSDTTIHKNVFKVLKMPVKVALLALKKNVGYF